MSNLNPRIDFVFKKLFGAEENKDILIDFINAVVSERDQVIDLEIKNPYNEKQFATDKQTVLDIKARDLGGTWFNIEMQMVDQDFYAQRALYYWSRLYVGQLSTGVNYDRLTKTIGINILNFNCTEEQHYHNEYRLLNVSSKRELIEHQQIHFIELEKFDEKISTVMDRWVKFLNRAGEYSINTLPGDLKEVQTIKKAMEVLETMRLSAEEREFYEARLKWIRDEKAAHLSAERRGEKRGEERGRRKAQLDFATRLLKQGLGLKEVAEGVCLPLEEVQALALELQKEEDS